MIPHGDRRDRAHSRRVEDEHEPLAPGDNHVVGVLVLGDDVGDEAGRFLNPQPIQHARERTKLAKGNAKPGKIALGDGPGGIDGNWARH